MANIRLRNNDRVDHTVAIAVWMNIRELADENPGAVRHLVAACRDPEHVIPLLYHAPLYRWNLIQGFTWDEPGYAIVAGPVKSVVLSAAEGDGDQMTLNEPWIPGQTEV